MSLTYIGAIVQFLVMLGVLSQEESQTVSDGIVAILSLVTLGITLYGRWRLGGVTKFGIKE